MLKQTVTYTDFDNNETTETLYFNVSRSRLVENYDAVLVLETELREVSQLFEGEERTLAPDEVQRVLDIVKKIMALAYGVRSEDGKRFRQSDELWSEFQETAAYEEYLWSLFQNPTLANQFIVGVMPPQLIEEAKAEAEKRGMSVELPSV
jgi:hypothetical protein